MRSLVTTATALVLMAAAWAAPAGALPLLAPGSEMYPVADRYEPGQVATMVGYTGRGAQGWIEDGPFSAFLGPAGSRAAGRYVGVLTATPTGHEGWRALRVAISFPVPRDLEPGPYRLYYCNDPCTTGLGDLEGGSVSIGVDPTAPVLRMWSPDEPEIAAVRRDAVILGPGYEAVASVIREGQLLPVEPPPLRMTSVAPPAPAPAASVPVRSQAAQPSKSAPASQSRPASPARGAASAGWLVFGAGLAAVCVVSVLRAMRQDVPPRMATS